MATQKFQSNDLVRIAATMPPWMSHFTADEDAIVVGSYADLYGGDNRGAYKLFIKGQGGSAWYDEHQLTLMKANQPDVLAAWERDLETRRAQQSDLDWIFAQGAKLLESAPAAAVEALARCLGITNMWGGSGEGYVYYANAHTVLTVARPYLEAHDKAGWLEFAKGFSPA